MQTIEATIVSKQEIKKNILELGISRSDGNPLPRWTAGSHITVILNSAVERQYSICEASSDNRIWTIAVKVDDYGRGGSLYIKTHCTIGQKLKIRGPINTFPLRPANNYLFIAGGIGITPILSMISRVKSTGKNWRLIYTGKNAANMPFIENIKKRY